jgi:hypothetical protein
MHQYRKAEELSNEVLLNDTVREQSVKRVPGKSSASKSFSDLGSLMKICVELEDQLWAMTQGA